MHIGLLKKKRKTKVKRKQHLNTTIHNLHVFRNIEMGERLLKWDIMEGLITEKQ